MSLTRITIQGKVGSICSDTVHAVLPSLGNNNTCEVYCDIFPMGLTIDGNAQETSALFWKASQPEEEDEDECEG